MRSTYGSQLCIIVTASCPFIAKSFYLYRIDCVTYNALEYCNRRKNAYTSEPKNVFLILQARKQK